MTTKKGSGKLMLWRFRKDAQIKGKTVVRFGKRKTQDEMLDDAFRVATKRTGTFAGKHAR